PDALVVAVVPRGHGEPAAKGAKPGAPPLWATPREVRAAARRGAVGLALLGYNRGRRGLVATGVVGPDHWRLVAGPGARRGGSPSLITIVASGRSSHLGSGTPITATSATAGCSSRWFSTSTDELHSPPDLMTSLARSVSCRNPSGLMYPTSPVRSQPSSKESELSTP